VLTLSTLFSLPRHSELRNDAELGRKNKENIFQRHFKTDDQTPNKASVTAKKQSHRPAQGNSSSGAFRRKYAQAGPSTDRGQVSVFRPCEGARSSAFNFSSLYRCINGALHLILDEFTVLRPVHIWATARINFRGTPRVPM
jgi:hypothetical protein